MIFFSDIHLMDSNPICRLDHFQMSMREKVQYLLDYAKEQEHDIFIAGDICDKWKLSPALEGWFIKVVKASGVNIYTICGQHDLPEHNMRRLEEGSYHVFMMAGIIQHLDSPVSFQYDDNPFNTIDMYPYNWNDDLYCPENMDAEKNIAIVHHFVYKGAEPWPGCTEPNNLQMIRKLKNFDLIVCGDNHEPFIHTKGKTTLLNCGSVFRTTAKQEHHKPAFYVVDNETLELRTEYLPIKADVISREHIDKQKERDARIEEHISRISKSVGDVELDMDPKENVMSHCRENGISKSIILKLEKAFE